MNSARYWMVVLLMGSTMALIGMRGDKDRVPESVPLQAFPETIDGRDSQTIPMEESALEVLGAGSFLNRTYLPKGPGDSIVGLFIGYFPTQRTGQSIHSPQHCLPGAGWTFVTSGTTPLKVPGRPDIQVGEYIIANGASKDEVLYWYRSHGRAIASDYTAKFYTLLDSLRYRRTDAALVRVVTPIGPDEPVANAHTRAVKFAEAMNAELGPYIPD